MINVILADDHDIVREGMRKVLESRGGIQVIAEASTGAQALQLCTQHHPDVLILDLDMPDGGGLETLPRILSTSPNTKVLILTMHEDEEYASRALREGASGYMLKASSAGDLPDAVRKIAEGNRHVAPAILERLALRATGATANDPISNLSAREFQVLAGLARGEQLKDTAARLNLSVSATATYRKRIKEKLNIEKNADLMLYAIKHGLDKKG